MMRDGSHLLYTLRVIVDGSSSSSSVFTIFHFPLSKVSISLEPSPNLPHTVPVAFMALAHCLFAVPVETSKHAKASVLYSSSSSNDSLLSLSFASASPGSTATKLSVCPKQARLRKSAKAKPQESEVTLAAEAFTRFKHLLLPITDRNPYLSEGTRQAAATTAALAKKYGADITVVLISEKQKESLPEHETQLSSIRWHLSEGGFQEFRLLERLGEENKPTAIIGEVADDLDLDLVVMSMEAIHSKHVDANLLAEFIPCPVLLLPL